MSYFKSFRLYTLPVFLNDDTTFFTIFRGRKLVLMKLLLTLCVSNLIIVIFILKQLVTVLGCYFTDLARAVPRAVALAPSLGQRARAQHPNHAPDHVPSEFETRTTNSDSAT